MYTNDNQSADEGSTPDLAVIPASTGDGNPAQRPQLSVALGNVIDELLPVLGSLGLGQFEHTLRTTLKKLSKGELELADTLKRVIKWLYGEGNDTACEFARRLEELLPPEEEVADEAQSLSSQLPILHSPMVDTPPAASPPMPVRAAVTPKAAAQMPVPPPDQTSAPAKLPAVPAHISAKPPLKAKAGRKNIVQTINSKTDTAEPPTVQPAQYGWMNQPDEHPLLAGLRASRYSRSFTTPPTDESIEVMVSSIMEYGLINSLILAADPDAPGVYEVVAGEHRRQALLRIRPDGRLQPDEYRIVSLPATDKRLASVSMEENKGRNEPSPYELALLANHLIEDEKFTQEEVAKLMGKFQPTINGLQGLARNAKILPEAWRQDLRKPPTAKASIRLAHWLAVKPHLDDDGSMPTKIRKICEEAASSGWSVAKLKKVLGPSTKRAAASPITDTSNIIMPKQPEIETPGVKEQQAHDTGANPSDAPSASQAVAMSKLRSWAEGLLTIADEMHEHQSVHEANVRAALHAIEADLTGQKNEETA